MMSSVKLGTKHEPYNLMSKFTDATEIDSLILSLFLW